MSTSEVLQHLYSLDTASANLPPYFHRLIQCDEEDEYLSSLQGQELTRLVDLLDEVRTRSLPRFIQSDEQILP